MNFDLVRPCTNCPFRTDVEPFIRLERIQGIVQSLLRDSTFACHKTAHGEWDDELEVYTPTHEEQHCAGALIFLHAQGLTYRNFLLRFASRIGMYDPTKLVMDSPVFVTRETLFTHFQGQ